MTTRAHNVVEHVRSATPDRSVHVFVFDGSDPERHPERWSFTVFSHAPDGVTEVEVRERTGSDRDHQWVAAFDTVEDAADFVARTEAFEDR